MVFIFFGLVSVCGSYFLFTKTFDWDMLLPASAIGLLSAAVLNLNNMRRHRKRRKSGKKTLCIKIRLQKCHDLWNGDSQCFHRFWFWFTWWWMVYKNKEKYYAFIFFITVFPLTALRRNDGVKEQKRIRPILKTIRNHYFINECFGGFWIELF